MSLVSLFRLSSFYGRAFTLRDAPATAYLSCSFPCPFPYFARCPPSCSSGCLPPSAAPLPLLVVFSLPASDFFLLRPPTNFLGVFCLSSSPFLFLLSLFWASLNSAFSAFYIRLRWLSVCLHFPQNALFYILSLSCGSPSVGRRCFMPLASAGEFSWGTALNFSLSCFWFFASPGGRSIPAFFRHSFARLSFGHLAPRRCFLLFGLIRLTLRFWRPRTSLALLAARVCLDLPFSDVSFAVLTSRFRAFGPLPFRAPASWLAFFVGAFALALVFGRFRAFTTGRSGTIFL